MLIPMAGVKTRKQSYSKLSELVGPGNEFLTSEAPTLFAVIQKGILITERVLVELGKVKTEVYSKDIIAQLQFFSPEDFCRARLSKV